MLIDWFKENKIQTNPDNFQVITLGKNPLQKCVYPDSSCEETVKLFGFDAGF